MTDSPFIFDAGNLALDLVNTRPISGGERRDYLTSSRELAAWLRAAGLPAPGTGLGPGAPALTATRRERLLVDARTLRDAVEELVTAKRDGAGFRPRALETINGILATRRTHPVLQATSAGFTTGQVVTTVDHSAVLAPVAAAAVELLTEAEPGRLRQCDDDDCVLWFLDTSRNGRRRWCSMARCGNRAKVAAHYRRGKRRRR